MANLPGPGGILVSIANPTYADDPFAQPEVPPAMPIDELGPALCQRPGRDDYDNRNPACSRPWKFLWENYGFDRHDAECRNATPGGPRVPYYFEAGPSTTPRPNEDSMSTYGPRIANQNWKDRDSLTGSVLETFDRLTTLHTPADTKEEIVSTLREVDRFDQDVRSGHPDQRLLATWESFVSEVHDFYTRNAEGAWAWISRAATDRSFYKAKDYQKRLQEWKQMWISKGGVITEPLHPQDSSSGWVVPIFAVVVALGGYAWLRR